MIETSKNPVSNNNRDEDFDMGSVYTEDRGMRAFLIPSFLPLKTGE